MSRPLTLSRPRSVLAVALVATGLGGSAARADSSDLRSRMHTSSLAGTSEAGLHARTPSDVRGALAQERYYSSYGAPAPLVPPVDAGDDGGPAPLPFVLAMAGGLVIGVAAGSAGRRPRRRRAAHAPGGAGYVAAE